MTDPFTSLSQLRTAHNEMRKRVGRDAANSDARRLAIETFLLSAQGAGVFIDREDERQAASDLLEYWTIELAMLGDVEEQSFSMRKLAPFAGTANVAATNPEADKRKLELNRLAALARQWRDSSESAGANAAGYLLSGDALINAEQFKDENPVIGALVRASRRAEVTNNRRRNRQFVGAIAFFVFTTIVTGSLLIWTYNLLNETANLSELQVRLLQKLATDARENEQRLRDEGQRSASILNLATEVIIEQVRAEALQLANLSAEIRELTLARIGDDVAAGRIDSATLPFSVRNALGDKRDNFLADAAAQGYLTGYDPAFLAVSVPLLRQPGVAVADLVKSGEPIPYINYSLVLDAARRSALYAAVNLDRSQRIVAPSNEAQVTLDPRVEPKQQTNLAVIGRDTGLVPGLLVSRDFISWGAELTGQHAMRDAVDKVVLVRTNVVPQREELNRNVWNGLQTWILTEHNPLASRVNIFTGPIFAPDDPVVGGTQIAQRFWAIAISDAFLDKQQASDPALVVDAFIVSGTDPAAQEQKAFIAFDAERFRRPVAEIEQLTGLDFSGPIRDADQVNPQTTNYGGADGSTLAVFIPHLDAPDLSTRQVTAQDLVFAVRDNELTPPEQRVVVAELLNILVGADYPGWSSNGRFNLLFVLSEIQADKWNNADWAELKGRAVEAVAAIEQKASAGELTLGPSTRRLLAAFKKNLGVAADVVDERSAVTVYLQFPGPTRGTSGMSRAAAEELRQRLVGLNWTLPGIEQTDKAIGTNEVRYNPASASDTAAAEQLVEDLRGLGRNVSQVAVKIVRPGILELWISN